MLTVRHCFILWVGCRSEFVVLYFCWYESVSEGQKKPVEGLAQDRLRLAAGYAILGAWKSKSPNLPSTSVGPGPTSWVGPSRSITSDPTWSLKSSPSQCSAGMTCGGRSPLPSRSLSGNGSMAWPPSLTWFLTELRIVTGRHGDPRRCPIILSWQQTQCFTPLCNLCPNSVRRWTPIGRWFMTSWKHKLELWLTLNGKKLRQFITLTSTIRVTDVYCHHWFFNHSLVFYKMKEYKFAFIGIHKRNDYHDMLCYLAETAEEALNKCQTIQPDFEIHNWGLLEHMV